MMPAQRSNAFYTIYIIVKAWIETTFLKNWKLFYFYKQDKWRVGGGLGQVKKNTSR